MRGVSVEGYNVLELMRLRSMPTDDQAPPMPTSLGNEYVAPLVDGDPLAVLAWRDGVSSPSLAIPYDIVAPPSRHWLGEPLREWSGEGGVIFLTMDSEVADPLPGGLRAFIDFDTETVTWRVVSLMSGRAHGPRYKDYKTFRFHKPEYESVIARLPSQSVYGWEAHLSINQQWWDAVLGR